MGSMRGIVLLLLAALFAAVAGTGFYMKLKAVAPGKVATVPLVVAAKDITFGTKLDAAHLKMVDFPAASVPAAAYTSMDSVLGNTTKVFLVEGEPILASKLSSVGGGLSVRIPETKRASSVNVNEISGVSGFILPGDRVDVIVTIDNLGETRNSVAKTILQDVEILAAGVKTETKNDKPLDVQSVTLLVDPKGAEDLALAIHQGKIQLVLRNPMDRHIADVSPTTTTEVMGIARSTRAKAPAPRKEKKPVPVVVIAPPPAPKPAPDPSYTVIRDGRIQEQTSPTEKHPADRP